jgi:hypothetical protein
VSEPDRTTPARRSRTRDLWQLHIPLVLVLTLCTVITVIEYRRATDGVWRAWVYLFEWPMIAAFSVWMWHRFRTEGNPARGMSKRWQERVARIEAEYDAEQAARAADPELAAWRDYQERVQAADEQQPPA